MVSGGRAGRQKWWHAYAGVLRDGARAEVLAGPHPVLRPPARYVLPDGQVLAHVHSWDHAPTVAELAAAGLDHLVTLED